MFVSPAKSFEPLKQEQAAVPERTPLCKERAGNGRLDRFGQVAFGG